MPIVPRSTYHVAVKYSQVRNRVVAEFKTVVEPYINIEFPLPDRYEGADQLSYDDEELLALHFAQIVDTALKGMRQQQEMQRLLAQAPPIQPGVPDQGVTQDVLVGEDEPGDLDDDPEDPA